MQNLHVDIIMCLSAEMKIIVQKKKIVIIKKNIAIRIAGKVSRYIDASMNRATPNQIYGHWSLNLVRSQSWDSLEDLYLPVRTLLTIQLVDEERKQIWGL